MRADLYTPLREEVKDQIKWRERKDAIREMNKFMLKRTAKIKEKIPLQKLADRVREIKKKSIENIENIVKVAMENLEENGICVHYVRNAKEAGEEILKVCDGENEIIKCGTDMLEEIGFYDVIREQGIKIYDTDFGYTLLQYMPEEKRSCRPAPLIHLPLEVIAGKLSTRLGIKVEPKEEDIVRKVKAFASKHIAQANIGIVGANAIAAREGSFFLLHDLGNITKVIGSVPKLVSIAGIEKIAPTLDKAFQVVNLQSFYTEGAMVKQMNLISGPTEAKEVGRSVVKGVYGPKEVHMILVDNGRIRAIREGFGEWLHCIHCWSCLQYCPVYDQAGMSFGFKNIHPCGVGVIRAAFCGGLEEAVKAGLYLCALCGVCKEKCPLQIDIPSMIERIRNRAVKKGLIPPPLIDVEKNIELKGNPYGESAK